MIDWVYSIIAVLTVAFLHLLWKFGEYEREAKDSVDQANQRLQDLKTFRVRNPLRNIARIRTCYMILESGNIKDKARIDSFNNELTRRLDLCEQQLGSRPANFTQANILFEKVRRGRR